MRHDARNSGAAPLRSDYSGDRPWSYRTGRGVFSTPVVGADGAVYVGSADGRFYAFEPDGRVRWSATTGGVIDSAALLGDGHVTVGSGDGSLYRYATGSLGGADAGTLLWRFEARAPGSDGQQVSWWEGNVAAGPDGVVLAGNTGGRIYAIGPDGHEVWSHETGNAVWTAAAVDADGTSYFGSLDFSVRALDASGRIVWTTGTFGFVVSSPALSLEGTLYVGSFDGHLYALDAATGAVRWTVATGDSIYASPCLLEQDGTTRAVVVASTDGSVSCLTPEGELVWRYDTGAVVRSSPVAAAGPSGEGGQLVYVGAADGTLYALDADRGRRRWSFDTTSTDPWLADRRSLNGAPALSRTGIHIGSEDGSVWYVPFDYPLHSDDPRGSTDPGEPFPAEMARLLPVTPGGSTVATGHARVGPGATLALRLLVRERGTTLDAEIERGAVVTADPPVELVWRRSGDGHHLFISPREFWPTSGEVTLSVRGSWSVSHGEGVGRAGEIDATLLCRSDALGPDRGLRPGRSFLQVHRLSVALPSFAPSVNQIGFDSYDWLAGVLAAHEEAPGRGRLVLLVHGAMRGVDGLLTVDPHSSFCFAMAGRYLGDAVTVSARDVDLPFSFGTVPLRRFTFAFQLDEDLVAAPGSSLYGETVCADVPFYGPLLAEYTRLADSEGIMATSGTFLVEPADPRSPATKWPAGLQALDATVERSEGGRPRTVAVRLDGEPGDHLLTVVLLGPGDEVAAGPVRLGTGDLASDGWARFPLPTGSEVPAYAEVVVVAGVVPIARLRLD